MKEIYTINLDNKIFDGKPSTKFVKIDKNSAKTISGIIYYLLEENNVNIAELGYIKNDRQIGIIIPKLGTRIGNDSSRIGQSLIVTFYKRKVNKDLKIYETYRLFNSLKEVIENTIKEGEFIKSETMPKEFVKYLY